MEDQGSTVHAHADRAQHNSRDASQDNSTHTDHSWATRHSQKKPDNEIIEGNSSKQADHPHWRRPRNIHHPRQTNQDRSYNTQGNWFE